MKYNVYISGKYHHKNEEFLRYYVQQFNLVDSFDSADIIFSPNVFYEIHKYPKKVFIFGPHFSILPGGILKDFDNKYNNAVYLLPSKQVLNLWKNEFKYDTLKLVWSPFGVNTQKFKPSNFDKTEVLLYYKRRDPNELYYVENVLKNRKIQYKKIEYGKYQETDYVKLLQKAKYGIWVGEHESQGFALQEALAMNVPLLVWSTTLLSQEWNSQKYLNIKSKMVSNPYWDNRCGEVFYDVSHFEIKLDYFLQNLKNYKPRDFVIENLSFEKCNNNFNVILNTLFNISI